jgi:hypothetical protein
LNDPKELVADIRLRDPGGYAQDITRRNIEHAYFRLLLLNPNLTPAEATNQNVGVVLSLTEDPCSTPMGAHNADQ